jgi:pyruvate kinase
LARVSGASRIIVATNHGKAPRLVSGYHPEVPITAVTDRLSAARMVQLLPGVDCVMVDEHPRGSDTMQEAIRELLNDERVKVNERIVAISGSPLAMRGATSTVRLYQISENGEILGVE